MFDVLTKPYLKAQKRENFLGADFLFVSKLLFPTYNWVLKKK